MTKLLTKNNHHQPLTTKHPQEVAYRGLDNCKGAAFHNFSLFDFVTNMGRNQSRYVIVLNLNFFKIKKKSLKLQQKKSKDILKI